jgi:phage gpG-like protein
MATLIIDIEIDIDEPQEKFEDMVDHSKDMRSVWRYAKKKLETSFSQNFLSGGSLVGGWAPLDRGYAAWKIANFPGAKKMNIDGKLFRSISTLEESAVNKIEKTSAAFGTEVKYAKFHQYGTTKMPKRPIIFEPSNVANKWGKWAVKYIADGETFGIKG